MYNVTGHYRSARTFPEYRLSVHAFIHVVKCFRRREPDVDKRKKYNNENNIKNIDAQLLFQRCIRSRNHFAEAVNQFNI